MAYNNKYKKDELETLHKTLHEILAEVIRICDKHDIPYFMIGGSAIGAFFYNDIIPFDDDIDIGMTRNNYERFLDIAPGELPEGYFLQWVKTDRHTPYYFAKVRKDNTLFIEDSVKNIDMHHGIFVDIFPMDKVPDNQTLQHIQRKTANFFNECLVAKEVWLWKYCGKCEIETPNRHGFINCLLNRIVISILPKRAIYKILRDIQNVFNNGNKHTYYNIVMTKVDHIAVKDTENLQSVRFGSAEAYVPDNVETYLRRHYPNLRKEIPEEEQVTHRPMILSFDAQG